MDFGVVISSAFVDESWNGLFLGENGVHVGLGKLKHTEFLLE